MNKNSIAARRIVSILIILAAAVALPVGQAYATLQVTRRTLITGNGGVSISTSQSEFGGASALFDGTTGYLTSPDSDNWYFGTGDFTVDFWARFNALPTNGNSMVILSQYTDNNNYFGFRLSNSAGTYQWVFVVSVSSSSSIFDSKNSPGLSTSVWYHIVLVRSGSYWYVFQGGALCGSTYSNSNSVPNESGSLLIGAGKAGANPSYYMNGWLDEFRVSKGIARWTNNFAPPTAPYVRDSDTVLLLHMDDINGSTSFVDDVNTSTITTQTTLTTTPSKRLLWSADFESGNQNSYFNAPNRQNIVPGNNPGEVTTNIVHSGKYAGYYYITSNPSGGWVRDYWAMDWTGNQPVTHDFIVEAWIYLPKQNITSCVSFITIGFNGYHSITIDLDRNSLPNRYLKIYASTILFANQDGYQSIAPKVQLPFDKWVKLDVEVHYRPSAQLSNIILYQDDVKIVDFKTYALGAQPSNLLNLHFGLYCGAEQQTLTVYNDDLALYDIS